jgi:hypothetical protein
MADISILIHNHLLKLWHVIPFKNIRLWNILEKFLTYSQKTLFLSLILK